MPAARNPLKEGTHVDTGRTVRIEIEPEGKISPRLIPKVGVEERGDEAINVSISVDAREAANLPKIANSTLKRRGFPAISATDITEHARTESLGGEIKFEVNIDLHAPLYEMLKIAHELSWRWLGDSFLDDPTAKAISASLRAGKGRTPPEVNGLNTEFDDDCWLPWVGERNSFIAFLLASNGRVSFGVRLQDMYSGLFFVSDSAASFALQDDDGFFYAIDPATGVTRESTFGEEATRLAGTGIGGVGEGVSSQPPS